MNFVISIAVLLEILLLYAAAFVLFRRWEYSLPESVTCAVVTTMLGISFVLQSAFLLGVPRLSMLVEVPAAVAAVVLVAVRRKTLQQDIPALRAFAGARPLVSVLLTAAWAYLGAQALLLPEGNFDSMRYNLTRVLLFQQEKTLFLTHITEYPQAIFPVGADILTHLFLRFYTDYGVALFSFSAYLAIGFGTYALARRQASVNASFTAALVAFSLPLVVHQATGTKPDIIAASVAVCCLVLAGRLYDRAGMRELSLLMLALCFGVSAKTTFLAFAAPFMVLFGFLLLRRHGAAAWKTLLVRHWRILLPVLVAALVLSNVWLFARNHTYWGHWSGPEPFVQFFQNRDGLKGTAANLGRYLLQSLHFLTPTDMLLEKIGGHKLSDGIEQVYFTWLYPLWKDAGAVWPNHVVSFALSERVWGDSENGSWFGPLGCLLILPAMGYGLVRVKQDVVRVHNLVLIAYGVIISWQIAWMPWNCRFLTLLFVCGACNAALVIDRLRWRPGLIRGVQVLAFAVLFYSMAFNTQKPITFSYELRFREMVRNILTRNVWVETNWGRDRNYYNRRYFGDDRVAVCSRLIPPGARVGVVSYYLGWTFPFLLNRPEADFVLFLGPKLHEDFDFSQDFSSLDYLLCINNDGHAVVQEGRAALVWKAEAGESVRRGALLKLPKKFP